MFEDISEQAFIPQHQLNNWHPYINGKTDFVLV